MKKLFLIGLILGLILTTSKAQTIEHIDVQLVDGNIVLAFDLLPKASVSEQYDLEITSSRDNYKSALSVLKGSLKNVRPTNRLHYTIDASNFEGFKGDLYFEVEATLVYTPLRFISPSENLSVKKGKSISFSWRGGKQQGPYHLELFKAGKKIDTLASNLDRKVTTWDIPKDFKAGGNYMVKVASEKDANESAFTKEFKIKRKIPVVLKILPVFVAGGIFAIISGGGSEGGSGTTGSELPAAPDRPD